MSGFKAVWLGDADPMAQVVEMGDLRFVKGETVTVPAGHEFAERIKANPMFAVDDSKAKPAEADEGEPVDPEKGTEIGAVKAELRARGIKWQGNPSLDTLRGKLAEAE